MNSNYGGIATLNNRLGSNISSKTTLDNTFINFDNSLANIITNSQINYTLIGIVAKENKSYESGYEVADHVSGNVTLVLVDTEKGSRQYISIDLGPKKEGGGQPGVNLIEYIKDNYPNLKVIVTGRILVYQDPKIRNETATPGTDIDDVIVNYGVRREGKELKDDEVTEGTVEVDRDYVIPDQNPDSKSDSDEDLVTAECESENSESVE